MTIYWIGSNKICYLDSRLEEESKYSALHADLLVIKSSGRKIVARK